MVRLASIVPLVCVAAAWAVAGSSPEVPPVPPVIQPSAEEVKTLAAELDKAVADKNDESLAKSLEKLEGIRNDAFAKYIRDGMKSSSPGVLAASMRAAATHEMKDVEKDVRKLLHAKPPKRDKDPTQLAGEIGAAAIDYLARLDFGGEETVVVDEYLAPVVAFGYDDKRVGAPWALELVRASVHYVGKFKAKHAAPQLIEMVGEPKPKPFNSTKGDPNPPEAYWKCRSQIWNKSEGWVRWALKEITGQSYQSQREWEAWLKQNKKDFK